jgi:hypothetical protein
MAFLVDQNVINVADLVVRRIVNILLVEIGYRGARRQPGEDLRGPSGRRSRLLGEGRRTKRLTENELSDFNLLCHDGCD